MKLNLSTLFAIAQSAMKQKLDGKKFAEAVSAWANRHAKGVTLSTRSHEETKENGVRISGTLSTKVDKHEGRDGRALHWLGIHAESIALGWEAPALPEEVEDWLEKFIPEVPPTNDNNNDNK